MGAHKILKEKGYSAKLKRACASIFTPMELSTIGTHMTTPRAKPCIMYKVSTMMDPLMSSGDIFPNISAEKSKKVLSNKKRGLFK